MPCFIVRRGERQPDVLSDVAVRQRLAAKPGMVATLDGNSELSLGQTFSMARHSRAGAAIGGKGSLPAGVPLVGRTRILTPNRIFLVVVGVWRASHSFGCGPLPTGKHPFFFPTTIRSSVSRAISC